MTKFPKNLETLVINSVWNATEDNEFNELYVSLVYGLATFLALMPIDEKEDIEKAIENAKNDLILGFDLAKNALERAETNAEKPGPQGISEKPKLRLVQ